MQTDNFDTLLHLSSDTETTLRAINNFLIYFLMWTGGSDRRLTFISMNYLCTHNVIDTGIAKNSLGNIKIRSAPDDFNNNRDHYLQGYWEVKDGGDYSAVSLKMGYPTKPTIKLKGANSNWCYLTKYKRYSDDKEFYFIQMTQNFAGYYWKNSYKGISELVQYIQKHYPGEYIIVGNFQVQGHEKVFKHFLGNKKYHICPFFKTATCNSDDGIASPDGLVVSKELYMRVEFAVDFYSGYSYQHYIVKAKLYPYYPLPGTYDTTDPGFIAFIKFLRTNHGARDFYMSNAGNFTPSNKELVGSPINIRKIKIPESGPITYIATKKMNER